MDKPLKLFQATTPFTGWKVRKPCGLVGFGISMEPPAWHCKTCSEGSPRVGISSAEMAANGSGEAGATERGEREVWFPGTG